MEYNGFIQQTASPFSGKKLEELKRFLKKSELEYDEKIEYTSNILNEDYEIIATASIDSNILKCIAVDDKYRGQGLLAKLMTEIMNYAVSLGRTKLFLFTKPKNNIMFRDFGFYKIAETSNVLLMENSRDGFKNYINRIKDETESFLKNRSEPKKIGAIVANCNPFTLGHRYLIETAAGDCDLLHVFILAGDRKYFTEDDRYSLVEKGCKDLDNVIVHRAGEYLISPVTFPTYFIKDKYKSSEINCELDLKLFMEKVAKELNITERYVGTEPNDIVTNSYNNMMQKYFSESYMKLHIINRKMEDDRAISATIVRKAIDKAEIPNIIDLVPRTTYDFIVDKFKK